MNHLLPPRLCRFGLLALFGFSGSVPAATYTVDRTDDAAVSACSAASNDCTLRGAITAANANADADADTVNFDTTVFATSKTITLATAFENLIGDVTITGPGADKLTVTAATNSVFSIFRLDQVVSATFSGLTLSNAYVGIYSSVVCAVTATNCTLSGNTVGISSEQGGAIIATNCTVINNISYGFVDNGPLTVTNCTVSGNYVGIYSYNSGSGSGTATLNHCTVSSNTTDGIVADGSTLTATNCIVSGNGNGISNSSGMITATGCTLSGNSTNGIRNGGTLTATNCSLSGNDTGIYNAGPLTVSNCTLSGNTNIGIINYLPLTLKNTLVVGNPTNVQGPFTDGGHNITSGTAADAGLDPAGLQDNGGPTKTIALLPGSPAIDAGDSTLTTDQRGFSRPSGSAADIGAFEFFVPALSVNNPRSLNEGSAAAPGSTTFDITLNGPSTQSVTVNYLTTIGTKNPATAGSDYVEKHGKLTFAPGETLKRVTVFFIGDSTPELNETFFFDLKTPTNATIFDGRGVGQINNDDGPSLSIANAPTVNEGNGESTPQTQTFLVTLSVPSTNTVTVIYATANGTATSEQYADYTAASGTLTFAPGETSKIVTITLTGDTKAESNETYKVSLGKPTYAVLGDALAVGIIRNDDATPQAFQTDEPSQ